jgi:hypothetical protein
MGETRRRNVKSRPLTDKAKWQALRRFAKVAATGYAIWLGDHVGQDTPHVKRVEGQWDATWMFTQEMSRLSRARRRSVKVGGAGERSKRPPTPNQAGTD